MAGERQGGAMAFWMSVEGRARTGAGDRHWRRVELARRARRWSWSRRRLPPPQVGCSGLSRLAGATGAGAPGQPSRT